jgi:phospholipid/cholesterol/gamma-HCH transport system substrate-binding protein
MRVWRKRRRSLDEHAAAARNRRHGVIALVVIVAVLAATGFAYLRPTGKTGYTAHLNTAGGVRSGDDVRIAGIKVGKVTSVRLDRTLVEMKFDVMQSVLVGSESTLDIRLLTPLGGHYVALDPKGDIPLGRGVLPAQQTTIPFEVGDIIAAATPIVKDVDGQVIHDTFAEVAHAADRYPTALHDVISDARKLTDSLSKMTTDFHNGLDFVDNGLRAAVAARNQIITLTDQLALLGRTYTDKSADIIEIFALLNELGRIADRIGVFYGREVAPIVNGIDDIIDTLVAHPDRIGKAFESLGQIGQIVVPMLSGNGIVIDEGHFLVPGQDLCLPHLMKQC